MEFKKYIDYFNFIRKNWNVWLAIFTTFHELRGEKKYTINTTAVNDLKGLAITSGDKKSAYIYQPVNYYMIETALDFLRREKVAGGLVDYGCGKGRVLAVAAHYGYEKITGIEFAPELCDEAGKNIQKVKQSYPHTSITIICDNALNYTIQPTDTIFIFFNPFDERVMLPVVKSILKSVKDYEREIIVVYFNPTEKEIFLSAGFREIWYYRKMEYLDFSILKLIPTSN